MKIINNLFKLKKIIKKIKKIYLFSIKYYQIKIINIQITQNNN